MVSCLCYEMVAQGSAVSDILAKLFDRHQSRFYT